MSDPNLNPLFRRTWFPPDPPKRSRPLSGKQGAAQRNFGNENSLLNTPKQVTPQFLPCDALRLERGAAHLVRLGPRAVAELLSQIGATHNCTSDILDVLDTFRSLTPQMLRCTGGDRFPVRLQVVP
jgi:hypothetical protein